MQPLTKSNIKALFLHSKPFLLQIDEENTSDCQQGIMIWCSGKKRKRKKSWRCCNINVKTCDIWGGEMWQQGAKFKLTTFIPFGHRINEKECHWGKWYKNIGYTLSSPWTKPVETIWSWVIEHVMLTCLRWPKDSQKDHAWRGGCYLVILASYSQSIVRRRRVIGLSPLSGFARMCNIVDNMFHKF